MTTPPAESSNGAPYWGDGHVGADASGSGVPHDEARLFQHLLQRIIGDGVTVNMGVLTRIAIHRHQLGQPADDLGEESRAAVLRAYYTWMWGIRTAQGGTMGVDASDITLLHQNVFGEISMHVASSAGTYVYVAPRGEVYVAAWAVTDLTAGGGPIQPLLQSSHPVGAPGTINGAPQSSQDGVAGHWALTPYLGGATLALRDVFLARDARGTPYLARGALIPFVGNGGGQHVINMPLSTDLTTDETDQARKFLEKLLFTLLPACVVALGPLSGVPDFAKLIIYIIMTVLIVLLVVGLSSRACTKHVVRLAICAGIFAMTVFVSVQFSQGIYVAVAGLVGVALSGITLAV